MPHLFVTGHLKSSYRQYVSSTHRLGRMLAFMGVRGAAHTWHKQKNNI